MHTLRQYLRAFIDRSNLHAVPIVFCVGLVASLWGGVIYYLGDEQARVLTARHRENDNLALLFEEHVIRTIRAAESVSREIGDEFRRHGKNFDLAQYAKDRRTYLDPYHVLSVIDDNGNIGATSISAPRPANFSDQSNFRHHLRHDTPELFISEPRLGVDTGKWTIYLSTRWNKMNGSYGGYSVVAMDPFYFTNIYGNLHLGQGAVANLVRRDGTMLARHTSVGNVGIGENLAKTALFTQHLPAADHGHFTGVSPLDGVKRLLSYRALKDYPLIVLIGVTESGALAAYQRNKHTVLLTAGIASVIILLFGISMASLMLRQARSGEALRESAKQLQLAAQAGNIGFWDRDIATSRTHFSDHWKRLLGYRADEIGEDLAEWRDRLHPDDRARVLSRVGDFLKGHETDYRVEYRLRHRDGTYRWIAARGELVRNADNIPRRIIGCHVDVTDYKQQEQELQSQIALLQLLNTMAHAADEAAPPEAVVKACLARIRAFGDWTIGHMEFYRPNGKTPFTSVWDTDDAKRYEAFIRHSEEQHDYRSSGKLVATMLRDKKPVWLTDVGLEQEFGRRAAAMEAGLHGAFAFPIIRHGEIVAYVEFFSSAPRPADVAMFSTAEMISAQFGLLLERQTATHAHAQLAAVVESSNDAIFTRDLQGRIVLWNAAAERLYGWTAYEAMGRTTIDLLVPPERTDAEPFAQVLREPDCSIEGAHMRRNGERFPVQITRSALRDAQGALCGISTITRDISGIKRNEQMLRDQALRLRQLSRQLRVTEEKERRAITRELHDRIGQNLSTLNLMCGMLGQQILSTAPAAVREQMAEIQDLLRNTSAHTRDLMSELRPLGLEEFGLFFALKDLAHAFTRKTQIPVAVSGTASAPAIPGDAKITLYRIVQEALSNIVKHARASAVTLDLAVIPGRVELTIADDGIGYDEALVNRQRTWGMTIMRERAEAEDIQFHAESAPGYGTRITLTMELAEA